MYIFVIVFDWYDVEFIGVKMCVVIQFLFDDNIVVNVGFNGNIDQIVIMLFGVLLYFVQCCIVCVVFYDQWQIGQFVE